MTEVFISYSRRDKEFVRRLHEALLAQKRDVWVDWEDIPATAAWRAEIRSGIEATNAVRADVIRRIVDYRQQRRRKDWSNAP